MLLKLYIGRGHDRSRRLIELGIHLRTLHLCLNALELLSDGWKVFILQQTLPVVSYLLGLLVESFVLVDFLGFLEFSHQSRCLIELIELSLVLVIHLYLLFLLPSRW